MTEDELDRAILITGTDCTTKTMIACRMVVWGWMNPYAAAKSCGVSASSVYRKLASLQAAVELPVCPACGQNKPARCIEIAIIDAEDMPRI